MKKTKAQLQAELEHLKAVQKQNFEDSQRYEKLYDEASDNLKQLRQKYFCLCTALKEISEANLALASVMERSV